MEHFSAKLELLRYATTALFCVWLWYVNRKLRRAELSFTLGALWSSALVVALLFIIFPAVLRQISAIIGTEVPSNFLFFASILFLVSVCFGLTLKDARHEKKVSVLVQELGLLRYEVSELRNQLVAAPERKRANE